jgi:hypothetical protein
MLLSSSHSGMDEESVTGALHRAMRRDLLSRQGRGAGGDLLPGELGVSLGFLFFPPNGGKGVESIHGRSLEVHDSEWCIMSG